MKTISILLICALLSSCSSTPNNTAPASTNASSAQTEELTIPKYNTFGITPDALFKKIGDKSSYSYDTKDSIEGMVEFNLTDTIYDVSYEGILDETTGEIMVLKASYPAKGNDIAAIGAIVLIDDAVN